MSQDVPPTPPSDPSDGAPQPPSGAGPVPPPYGAQQYPPPGYGTPGQAYPPLGYGPPPVGGYPYGAVPPEFDPLAKSKLAAGLLGILLGSLGIHRFYLGFNGIGLTMLLVSTVGGIVTCGVATGVVGVWGLVEGILYLTASPGSQWSVDATGRPLRS